MNLLSLLFLLVFTQSLEAKVEVLFNPYDPTLDKIAQWIQESQGQIDLALYNIDISPSNPIMKTLHAQDIQRRVKSGQLKIRLIFEGYDSADKRHHTMRSLAALGLEVRQLKSGIKMHHKFGVFDSQSPYPRLATGSGNWSLSSQRNYNENALFLSGEALILEFQDEFDILWSASEPWQEFQKNMKAKARPTRPSQSNFKVYFNSKRFSIGPDGIRKRPRSEDPKLTSVIVNSIENSRQEIKIATTRIKLKPIYEALLKAAARGVDIRIVVSQDDYRCHAGKSYSRPLSEENFAGHEKVHVRVKYYDLNPCNYMLYQMHHKYILIDQRVLLTGSFNWSQSAEQGHIENLVEIHYTKDPQLLKAYLFDFYRLWSLNRHRYDNLLNGLEKNERLCSFHPMSLEFSEIDPLVRWGQKLRCRRHR